MNQININLNETPEIASLDDPLEGKSYTKFFFIFLGVLVAFVVIYFLVILFKDNSKTSFLKPTGGDSKNQAAADVYENPLNGEKFKIKDAESWRDIRPLAVMINNHIDARPQAGLIDADLVYEIVAEGGITRYLAFFSSKLPEKIGPIRSTREYYLVLVKELGDAMLMHIGWSPQALEAIETWPVRSLGRGGGVFWRDNPRNVATEHTAYSNGKDLVAKGLELGWSGVRPIKMWKFKEDKKEYASAPVANSLSVDFWYKGDYSAGWKYDSFTNLYMRSVGFDESDQPIKHIDDVTKAQLFAKNLVVQFAVEDSILNDEKHRLDYQLIGSGEALIFLDGKVIKSTWSKVSRDERTMFYDLEGNEIMFNRGKVWISIVPDRNKSQVSYE